MFSGALQIRRFAKIGRSQLHSRETWPVSTEQYAKSSRTAVGRPDQALLRKILLKTDKCCAMVKNSDQTIDDAYSRAVLSNKKNNLYKQVLLACALARADDLGLVRGFQTGATWPVSSYADRYSTPIRFWFVQIWSIAALVFLLVGDVLMLASLIHGGPFTL
jgi:hypothetical protein